MTPGPDPDGDLPPLEPVDDLASADLDGRLRDEERARAQSDPAVRARRERMEAAARAVGRPVPPLPAGEVDALVARALAAGATDGGQVAGEPGGARIAPDRATVAPLRPSRVRRVPPVLVAAVLLVAVAVGIGLILSGGNADDQTARFQQTGQSITASPESAAADSAGGASGGEEEVVDLGSFSDEDALRRALAAVDTSTLRAATSGQPSTTAPSRTSQDLSEPDERARASAEAVARCVPVLLAIPGQELGNPLAAATARIGEREVIVISTPVLEGEGNATQLSIIDPSSCTVLGAVRR